MSKQNRRLLMTVLLFAYFLLVTKEWIHVFGYVPAFLISGEKSLASSQSLYQYNQPFKKYLYKQILL